MFKVIIDLEKWTWKRPPKCAPPPPVKVEVVYKPIWTGVCLTSPQKLLENWDFTPSPGNLCYCLTSLTVRTFSLASNLNLLCCNFSPLRPVIFPVDVMITLLLRSLQQFFRYLGVLSLPVAPAIPSKVNTPGSAWPSLLFSRGPNYFCFSAVSFSWSPSFPKHGIQVWDWRHHSIWVIAKIVYLLKLQISI